MEAGFEPAPTPRLNSSSLGPALAGGKIRDDEYELMAVDTIGRVERLASTKSSTAWSAIGELDGEPDGVFGVVWGGPGRWFAWKRNSEALLRIEDDRVTTEAPPLHLFEPDLEDYSEAVHVPGLGLVLATDQRTGSGGEARLLLRDVNGEWTELDAPVTPGEIETLAAFEQGFLYGGFSGVFAQFVGRDGHCAPLPDLGGSDVRYIVVSPDRVFVLTGGLKVTGVRVFAAEIEVRGTTESEACPVP
jgi:hypothetical protein